MRGNQVEEEKTHKKDAHEAKEIVTVTRLKGLTSFLCFNYVCCQNHLNSISAATTNIILMAVHIKSVNVILLN